MTRIFIEQEDTAKRRLALLELAMELGSVDLACEVTGYSKSSYYLFKRLYDRHGEKGLRAVPRQKPNLKNRVSSDVEAAVVAYAHEYPDHGQQRASEELKAQGINVSPSGVRSIWLRHGLESARLRLRSSKNSKRFLSPRGEKGTKNADSVLSRTVKGDTMCNSEAILRALHSQRTKTMVYTRVMGYHRPVESFNPGKRSEHGERVHFVERGALTASQYRRTTPAAQSSAQG